MINRWFVSALVFCVVLFVCWCGGVDFDQRSYELGCALASAFYAAGAAHLLCLFER